MQEISAAQIVRRIFAAATLGFLAIGLLHRADPRWLIASGVFGTIWLAWDLLVEHLLAPLTDWLSGMLSDGIGVPNDSTVANLRPTLDDTIRLLEGHLERGASRHVDINAALRLAEIYRLKHDEENARRVIDVARVRYPDAEELRG